MRSADKPQNGVAGLKFWRYDMIAGLQVALVSLPLSLGIAVASGAPPVTGLVSAIIAGLIFPFLGGAFVTISGPAAGLAPALLAGMLLLGNGDIEAGYPMLLVAIFMTGVVMIILSVLRVGKFVAMCLPLTVVEAMLAAIGLMIIIKQIPVLLGDIGAPAKPMLDSILTLPESLGRIDLASLVIGGICLFLMFYLNLTKHSQLRRIPPPLVICGLGIALGYLAGLEPEYLITMPASLLTEGITLPAFRAVIGRPDLWASIALVVITLTLIDSIESLATVRAVDKIDPWQRKSEPNVTLRAMGISNLLSSMCGGLTIIPGGIKSRANIDAGGRTLWANFYNAVFLLVFMYFAIDIIGRIPLATIGAVIIYVGWRLCEPRVFAKVASIGRDHIFVFVCTIIAILATDLLIGIFIGVGVRVLLYGYILTPSWRLVLTGRLTVKRLLRASFSGLFSLFRNPVLMVRQWVEEGRPHLHFSLSSLTGFNLLPLEKALNTVPPDAGISLELSESCRLIDRTTMEYLHEVQDDYLREDRPFSLVGVERLHPFTEHPYSTRVQDIRLASERARRTVREREMAKIANRFGFKFEPGTIAAHERHNFVYLRSGLDRQEHSVITGEQGGCQVRLFDYTLALPPSDYIEHRHTLAIIEPKYGAARPPDFAIAPGHYLERYLAAEYPEVDLSKVDGELARLYRLYANDGKQALEYVSSRLLSKLLDEPEFYIETRRGVMLVFRPEIEFETCEGVAELLAFTHVLVPESSEISAQDNSTSTAQPLMVMGAGHVQKTE